jgi:hypothetical protein
MTTATSPPPLGPPGAEAAGPAGGAPGAPAGASPVPAPAAAPPAPTEACPLCGGPLDPQQEWCLRCGAAARTRLAATPSWRGPVAGLAVVGLLALGVLAAALVKLAGDSGPAPPARTVTVTTPAAAAAPAAPVTPTISTPTTIPPTGSRTVPGATTAPGATTTTPRAITPGVRLPTPTKTGTSGFSKRELEAVKHAGAIGGAG